MKYSKPFIILQAPCLLHRMLNVSITRVTVCMHTSQLVQLVQRRCPTMTTPYAGTT